MKMAKLQSHERGVTLVEMLMATVALSVAVAGIGSLMLTNAKSQRALSDIRDSDADRAVLLQRLIKELGNSRVARYYNLPVTSSNCMSDAPSVQIFKDGQFRCPNGQELGLGIANYSFFSDTIAQGQYLDLTRISTLQHGNHSFYVYSQNPRLLTSSERTQVEKTAERGALHVTWPLVNDNSAPFVVMKNKEISGTLQLRYQEDFDLQPKTHGKFADWTILAGNSRGLERSGIVGGLSLSVNLSDPGQHFVKSIDQVLDCTAGGANRKQCEEIACDHRPDKDACRQTLGNDPRVVHYAVRMSSVHENTDLQTHYMPWDYNRSNAVSHWHNQASTVYAFPTRTLNLVKQRSDSKHFQEAVTLDVDLKRIVDASENIAELRSNWLVMPVQLTRYYLARERGSTVTEPTYALMMDTFTNLPGAKPQPTTIMKMKSKRIVFTRELGTNMLSIYEDFGAARPAFRIGSVALNDLSTAARLPMIAEYPGTPRGGNPFEDAPPPGFNPGVVVGAQPRPAAAGSGPAVTGGGSVGCSGGPLACGNLSLHDKQFVADYNGVGHGGPGTIGGNQGGTPGGMGGVGPGNLGGGTTAGGIALPGGAGGAGPGRMPAGGAMSGAMSGAMGGAMNSGIGAAAESAGAAAGIGR